MRILFHLAGWPLFRYLIGWVLTHMSFVIPVDRLRETPSLLAFFHPKPSYPIHILILPKRQLASLMAISDDDTDFVTDLFATVQSLIAELKLVESGYRLISNGGPYQEVPHLHFHLISGESQPRQIRPKDCM